MLLVHSMHPLASVSLHDTIVTAMYKAMQQGHLC